MWTKFWRQAGVLAVLVGFASGLAGCAQTPPAADKAADKPAVMRHGMVKVQTLLEAHPQWTKLRQLEQEVAAADSPASPSSEAMTAAKQEFEAAMKARQNDDLQAIQQKELQMQDSLNAERRAYMDELETEYRTLLVNIDLKLKTVQYAPTEKQQLQAERSRLESEMQQKLQAKDKALEEKFKQETNAYADKLKSDSEVYADSWIKDQMTRMKQETAASPDLDKQRQELNELSARVMQDMKQAVSVVAEREKLDMVWVYPAVKYQGIDITDAVKRELTK